MTSAIRIFDLRFKGQTVSANLQGIALRDVLDRLEREKSIWHKSHPSVLDLRISVEFTELALENGLKRIFAGFDYSLMFDADQNVSGVVIFGRARSTPGKAKKQPSEYKTHPAKTSAKTASQKTDNGFRSNKGSQPSEIESALVIDTRVIPNAPPPENPAAKPIDTIVVHNVRPPENPAAQPVDTTAVQNVMPPENPKGPETSDKDEKNTAIPGGAARIKPAESDMFKIIRNVPPPR
jgi:hypothetical protein